MIKELAGWYEEKAKQVYATGYRPHNFKVGDKVTFKIDGGSGEEWYECDCGEDHSYEFEFHAGTSGKIIALGGIHHPFNVRVAVAHSDCRVYVDDLYCEEGDVDHDDLTLEVVVDVDQIESEGDDAS